MMKHMLVWVPLGMILISEMTIKTFNAIFIFHSLTAL